MRILMLGAGAIGGYFGARLAEAGRDVTFLVRPKREETLTAKGLSVKSPLGDILIEKPQLLVAGQPSSAFDLVVLSCKAYDLDSAIADAAPFVGANTAIVPLLNGMAHLDALDRKFGADKVLGGQCAIAATLDGAGTVLHLNPMQALSFGERAGGLSPRVEAIAKQFEGSKVPGRASETIMQDMWEKWIFLASLASGTCLMRAAVGDIVNAPGGDDLLAGLLAECASIATAAGFTPRGAYLERSHAMLTAPGSAMTASMLRDIEGNARVEADHVVGDLIARGKALMPDAPLKRLSLAYTGLKSYEARRDRTAA